MSLGMEPLFMRRKPDFHCVVGGLVLAGLTASAAGAEYTVKTLDKEPPKEIAAGIRQQLQPTAIQLFDGDKPLYEFWFDKTIPLKSKPGSPGAGLDAIKETTLLGAAVVYDGQRDYRDDAIAHGVYTMRFGLQPQDGDHMGTSDYPYFTVLIPAAKDTEPGDITTFKTMTKASGKGTANGHPVVISLRPTQTDQGQFPKLNQPAPEHQAVLLKQPAKVADSGPATSIAFDLVFKGHGNVQ
jgi:hypothetical protein